MADRNVSPQSGRELVNSKVEAQKGLTLLELLFALAIVSILLSMGVPSFRNVIMDNRLSDGSNAFMSSINAARSSAIRYQRQATVCPIADYDAAVLSCSGDRDWADGWMVWVDQNRDSLVGAGEILSTQEPMDNSISFQSATVTAISYDGRGFLTSGGDDLLMCDNRTNEEGRVIRINGVGRTEVARQVCL